MAGTRFVIVWALALAGSGCLETSTRRCGDIVCPQGTTCASLADPDELICATEEQTQACASSEEGDACTLIGVSASWCHNTVCLPIVCGNTRTDRGEICDDGNTVTGDGTCSGDCASNETCGNGTVDPLRLDGPTKATNEQCDDGNLASFDGCSSSCRTELPKWTNLDGLPGGLYGASLAYDSDRDRVILFGGTETAPPVTPRSNTFAWDGNGWRAIPSEIRPAPRFHAAIAYDASRHRLVLFGGQTDSDDKVDIGDTWELDGERWTLIQTPVSPSARTYHSMVYDSRRKKIVLFGGFHELDPNGAYLADTWEYDGTWTKVQTPQSPAPRAHHAMVYDAKRGRVVVAGGDDETGPGETKDTWTYDGTTWTNANAPLPATFAGDAAAAYESATGRVLIFGGILDDNSITDTTYAFDGTSWASLGQTQPGPLRWAAAVNDARRGKILMFGGRDEVSNLSSAMWQWAGTTWSVAIPSAPPLARRQMASATDTRRGITWMFGGDIEAVGPTSEMYSFAGTWNLAGTGGPAARVAAAMAYDRAHDTIVLFGGSASTSGNTPLPAETWLWNGTSWTKASPATTPPARMLPMMTYDERRERVVMFGGIANSASLDDTWEWDGTSWTQATVTTRPKGRGGATLTWDAERGVSVLSGGLYLMSPSTEILSDLWTWDGTTWTQASIFPVGHVGATTLPRRTRKGLLTFGGSSGFGGPSAEDLFEYDGTTWASIVLAAPPPGRVTHASFSSPDGSSALVFAGTTTIANSGGYFGDLWQIRWTSDEPHEICFGSIDNDRDGLSGCVDPDCWATCSPWCPPGTSCDAAWPRCGDGTCGGAETCRICPDDCGACTAVCGDVSCDAGETTSCPGDCPP